MLAIPSFISSYFPNQAPTTQSTSSTPLHTSHTSRPQSATDIPTPPPSSDAGSTDSDPSKHNVSSSRKKHGGLIRDGKDQVEEDEDEDEEEARRKEYNEMVKKVREKEYPSLRGVCCHGCVQMAPLFPRLSMVSSRPGLSRHS